MNRLLMVGKPHGHGIRQATGHGYVRGGRVLGHLGQAGAFVGNAGVFGAERAGQLRLVGNRLHCERQGALEILCRCVTIMCHWFFAVSFCCPPGQLTARAADDSGSSSPKQRW